MEEMYQKGVDRSGVLSLGRLTIALPRHTKPRRHGGTKIVFSRILRALVTSWPSCGAKAQYSCFCAGAEEGVNKSLINHPEDGGSRYVIAPR
jgi:hypothetical protein